MTRPKRHHFVPKWYLEKFVDPRSGCLHAYDKARKYYWTAKPKQIMVKKDYNKQYTPKGIDPDILEKSLGEWLEPEAKRCFETLLTCPQNLTAVDSAIMMAYLEHQRLCVPRQAETAKHSIREVLLRLALQAPPDIIPGEAKTALMTGEIGIEIKDHFRFHFMKMASGFLIPYFARMEWEIVETEEGSSFITSDSPVSFVNIGSPPPLEPGIGLVGTRVFFPLEKGS